MFMQYARSGSKKQDPLNQTVAKVSGKEVDSGEQKESGQDNPSGTPTVSDVEDEKVPIESPSGAATDVASNNVDPNGSVDSDPDASNLASDASKAEVGPVKEGNDVANTISNPEEKGTALAESPDKTPGPLVAGKGAKGSGLGGQNDIPEEMKRFLKGGILGGPLLSDAALQEDEVDVPTLPEVIEIGELIHPGLAPAEVGRPGYGDPEVKDCRSIVVRFGPLALVPFFRGHWCRLPLASRGRVRSRSEVAGRVRCEAVEGDARRVGLFARHASRRCRWRIGYPSSYRCCD